MDANQINSTYRKVLRSLENGQLKNAFQKTRLFANELQMGEYTDRLNDLQQNYSFLLQYFVSGAVDTQRKTVYSKLLAEFFVLLNEFREELLLRNSSALDYSQKRYLPHTRRHASTAELVTALKYYHSQSVTIAQHPDTHAVELQRLRTNYEAALVELFGVYWLTTSYSADEKKALTQIALTESYVGELEKCLMVSALTMNLWRMFDEQKLMLLLDCCQAPNEEVRQRAIVGLWFVLLQYNEFLPYFPVIRNRLVLMADDPHVVKNFQTVLIQIIATADTDKITRKMQEEILPELMKISPMIKNKSDVDSLLNSEEWGEENPAWQEIIENSGAADKIRELTDLQMEGADVYMSTFSLLKSFPFFGEISNWFIPFDARVMAVNTLFQSDDINLLSAFVGNNVMCNSDKYSFCLSILQMPEMQRGMLTQSFKMEAEQLGEIAKDEALLTPDLISKNISKQYIQDVFRFFRLHPQHADFQDMFVSSLVMHQSYLFNLLSSDDNFVSTIAEYYFQKNHYKQAADLFELLAKNTQPSAALYQKMGYSYQQNSQLQQALDAYVKADIIQPDDLWTVRKMALCCRLSGDFTKALEYYQHADFLKPNQQGILLQIGHCYTSLKKYKEALAVYLKLVSEDDENPKVWRAIAWCAFVSGNVAQSDYFIQKVLEGSPTFRDLLIGGHVAWCKNNIVLALNYYRSALESQRGNWDAFMETFSSDKKYLISNNVHADEIPLVLDELYPQTF